MKSLSEQQAEIKTELKQLENRQKILPNRKHREERNPSLKYKGALIHPYGCCAVLQTALRAKLTMGSCTPHNPSVNCVHAANIADKQHSLRRILPVNKSK